MTVPDYPPVLYTQRIPNLYTYDTIAATIDSITDRNPEDTPVVATGVTALDSVVHPTLTGNQVRVVSGDSLAPFSVGVDTKTATGIMHRFVLSGRVLPDMIAFSSIIPGTNGNPPAQGDQIYTVNVDGTALVKLTNDPIQAFQPAWSPDGMHIAYQNSGNRLFNAWVMDFDGNNKTRIPSTLFLMSPSFAPDGRRAIFAYDDWSNATATATIMGIGESNVDGTEFKSLYEVPFSGHELGTPKYSKDGQRIAFSDYARYGNWEIVVMNADGSNITNLTHDPAGDAMESWLPSDSGLVFASDRNSPAGQYRFDVYKQDFAGNVVRLTGVGASDPEISPDGRRLIYALDGSSEFYIRRLDGTGALDSLRVVGLARFPTFRPRVR